MRRTAGSLADLGLEAYKEKDGYMFVLSPPHHGSYMITVVGGHGARYYSPGREISSVEF